MLNATNRLTFQCPWRWHHTYHQLQSITNITTSIRRQWSICKHGRYRVVQKTPRSYHNSIKYWWFDFFHWDILHSKYAIKRIEGGGTGGKDKYRKRPGVKINHCQKQERKTQRIYQTKYRVKPEESKEKFSGMTTKSERFGDGGRSGFERCEASSLVTFSSTAAGLLPGLDAPAYIQRASSATSKVELCKLTINRPINR